MKTKFFFNPIRIQLIRERWKLKSVKYCRIVSGHRFFSLFSILYDTYIPNRKFNSIRISVIRDTTIILKKSIILKMWRKFILHNNSEKLLTIWLKKWIRWFFKIHINFFNSFLRFWTKKFHVSEVLNVHVNENNFKIYFFRRIFFSSVKN